MMESNKFIEDTRERSNNLDQSIILSLKEQSPLSIEDIAERYRKPVELIQYRLKVLENYFLVEVKEGQIYRGMWFNRYNRDNIYPLNANDLDLKPREKLIYLCVWNLGLADRFKIFESLKLWGDHITTPQTVYNYLKKLTHDDIIEEVSKNHPKFKIKGKKKYYRVNVNIVVTESPEELFKQCRDYCEHYFKKEVKENAT